MKNDRIATYERKDIKTCKSAKLRLARKQKAAAQQQRESKRQK